MDLGRSEHRDEERWSLPMLCTGQNLDKMFEWRAIADSLEQSSIAFQVDICLILTVVATARNPKNDPFGADAPRKSYFFREPPKSAITLKYISSRTDLI